MLHQVFQHNLNIHWHFGDFYIDAYLSMPILLGLMLQERQIFIDLFFDESDSEGYRFSGLQTGISGVLLAVLFEEVLPRFCEGYTRDHWDYLAYAFGIVSFYFLINGAAQRQPKNLHLFKHTGLKGSHRFKGVRPL